MIKVLLKIFIAVILFARCTTTGNNNSSKVDIDFPQIKQKGKLTAITGFNAYSYFIYKGQPMGFEYELLERLGEYLNLEIEIRDEKNLDSMFNDLNSGKGDLIAFNLTVTNERKKNIAFTDYLHTTRQVLVQRKPVNWRKMKLHQIENKMVRNVIDLENDTVYVRANSSHEERLRNLSNEIGGEIFISEADNNLSQEDLIEMVESGEIKFTIADYEIAKLMTFRYSSLDIKTSISLPQKIAWAVRKNSDSLVSVINAWLADMKNSPDYYEIYRKYYTDKYAYRSRVNSEYFSKTGGKISEYDDLIKKLSKDLGWDWRLLASVIYQESQFNVKASSWAGAVGLMQLMPATAKQFGAVDRTDPHQSLKAGVKYLKYLDQEWKDRVTDDKERLKFVLASYNIGPGHIEDAVNLTEKYNADTEEWQDNVEVYLLKKSKPKFYNDDIVNYGYCSGLETSNYVEQIMTRYSQYCQLIPQ